MKNIPYKFIIILITLFVISCHDKDCCKQDTQLKEGQEAVEGLGLSIPSGSIFNLESKWITQDKDSILLRDLSTKITVAAMVFTHCESACPRIVADMQRIESAFTPKELAKLQFVLISMDPERDTPARFVAFSKEHQLNDWICLSSNEEATMEIANVLNVRVKKLSNGGFDHSNTIHLINKDGTIAFQQNGLAQEPTDIIAKIKTLL